jgi:hypothetical protein
MVHQRMKASELEARTAQTTLRRASLDYRRTALEAKIAAMRAEYNEELSVLDSEFNRESARETHAGTALHDLANHRSHSTTTER